MHTHIEELLSITKLQNLKAIHNIWLQSFIPCCVVINRKVTKFESNSQQFCARALMNWSCYQSQNYKIWKQFTTNNTDLSEKDMLLSITKLQNLKAIHNCVQRSIPMSNDVINRKTIKFESNSQRNNNNIKKVLCCYQSQNYKIWKQFTTILLVLLFSSALLSITKLQNLKAIHNNPKSTWKTWRVVINHKTTKFESNSQLSCMACSCRQCCYQSQNYKIWKQFTTCQSSYTRTL